MHASHILYVFILLLGYPGGYDSFSSSGIARWRAPSHSQWCVLIHAAVNAVVLLPAATMQCVGVVGYRASLSKCNKLTESWPPRVLDATLTSFYKRLEWDRQSFTCLGAMELARLALDPPSLWVQTMCLWLRAILTWCFSVDLTDKHCGQHSLEDKLSVMERTAFKVTSPHHSRNWCYSSRSQRDLAVCPLGWRFLLYTVPFISPLKVNIVHREGDLQNHA